jgi:hypothetical protein
MPAAHCPAFPEHLKFEVAGISFNASSRIIVKAEGEEML